MELFDTPIRFPDSELPFPKTDQFFQFRSRLGRDLILPRPSRELPHADRAALAFDPVDDPLVLRLRFIHRQHPVHTLGLVLEPLDEPDRPGHALLVDVFWVMEGWVPRRFSGEVEDQGQSSRVAHEFHPCRGDVFFLMQERSVVLVVELLEQHPRAWQQPDDMGLGMVDAGIRSRGVHRVGVEAIDQLLHGALCLGMDIMIRH